MRCFTCGSVIGQFYEQYKEIAREKKPDVAMDELGISRYCCRRMFLAHVEMMPMLLKYPRT